MFGSRVLVVALLVSGLAVALFGAELAGAKEEIAPSYKIKAVPAEKFKPGPKVPLGSFVPIGPADAAGGVGGSSSSQPRATLATSSLPGAGPPVLINEPGLTRNDNGVYVPDTTGGIGPKHYI